MSAVLGRAPLCFLDTETDGVHPDRRVWEVAVIRREPAGREQAQQFFVEIDLSTADPFGLRIGRFYDRHPTGRQLAGLLTPDERWTLAPALPARAAAQKIAMLTHGAHIVGCVPNFDTEVLAALLRREGLIPAWHYHLVDVEALAVGFLAGRGEPVVPPWSSEDLSLALGVEPPGEDERHTALGDARWAMRLYDAVMAGEALIRVLAGLDPDDFDAHVVALIDSCAAAVRAAGPCRCGRCRR